MNFNFRNLNPYVRYSYINTSARAVNIYAKPLYAYDHRLFYVIEGSITLAFENRCECVLSEGDCVMFLPRVGYRVLFDKAPSKFVITSFDFDETRYGEKSRHPDTAEEFDENAVFSDYHPDVFDDVHVIRGAFSIVNALSDMCRVLSGDSESKYDYASALMKAVIIELARIEDEKSFLGEKNDVIERIKNYVDSRFTENISNAEIGKMFGYHPYYINRLFKKSVGMTLHSYIMEKRISMAKSLLVNSILTPGEIGDLCGFSSSSYFSECFKARTGVVAGEYRKKYSK